MKTLDVDEVVAQLLVSEGFTDLEEVAFVELDELSTIEGFDEDTAQELQTRAREFIDRVNAELEARRTELGVSDDLAAIEGISPQMLVAMGEGGVKTIDDLAGCATDDLCGYWETIDGERKREVGILEEFGITPEEANDLIMWARVTEGWIEDPAEAEPEEGEEGKEEPEGESND